MPPAGYHRSPNNPHLWSLKTPHLDDLGEVAPLGVAQRCDHPIVDGEQVELREASREPGVGAVAAADRKLP